MIAHLNIGSNLGNRAEFISRAVSMLAVLGKVTALSAPIETEPWGFTSPNSFLNIGVNVETELNAADIICHIKEIERRLDPNGCHRTPNGNYADRAIDIDLIALGREISNDPRATIPHPRMHLREFVARPMAEILPGWHHPLLNIPIEKILLNLSNKSNAENVK